VSAASCYPSLAMSPTARLYYDDPLLLDFTATVTGQATLGGAPSVLLDRSAFYPESGGQMADRGQLGGHAITDVQVDDDGLVHHLLEGGALLDVGSSIAGRVDRARRRVHMALHTGQHMLSRALTDIAFAATVSSRLGETTCTIDVDRETLDERLVAEAEALVNAVVDDDAPIRAFFPTPDELAALPLRRAPKVTENIRVIAIGDLDVSPCGGTHCTRTAQVGLVRVLGVERYKGKARVTFSAGPRARRELWDEASVLRDLGRSFTCGPRDVPTAVEKLRRELGDAREALGHARGRLADAAAADLAAAAAVDPDHRAVAVLDEVGVEILRRIAGRITSSPEATAFLASRIDGALAVMISRGSASRLDCGAFLKRLATAAGGRGGGRPEHAEGRFPATTDWPAVVAAALAA
jgi:alanyl-tRNA synthetase